MKKKFLKEKGLIVEVLKEDCQDLKEFIRGFNIGCKFLECSEYENLFPTKISFNWSTKEKRYYAVLTGSLWQVYSKRPTLITFNMLQKYLDKKYI